MHITVWLLIFVSYFLKCLTQDFTQNNYIVRHDRADIVSVNEKYFSHMSFNISRYNRTAMGFNIEFRAEQNLGNNLLVSKCFANITK